MAHCREDCGAIGVLNLPKGQTAKEEKECLKLQN